MKSQSSLNDVFKFVNLKELKSVDISIPKKLSKHLYPNKGRTDFANRAFNENIDEVILSIEELTYGALIYNALLLARQSNTTTVSQFIALFEDFERMVSNREFARDLQLISNTIFLSQIADRGNVPSDIYRIRLIFLAYFALHKANADTRYLNYPLEEFLRLVINIPGLVYDRTSRIDIKSVGVADLLVVKQHILRYELTEIAHIENIMAGETRSREHRILNRTEETLITETETTIETEKELQTSDRFEMNKETSQTIREDQKYAADLNISAKYGPTLKIDTGFNMEISRSEENSSNSSSTYAKDIMQRSLDRVKERVREERIKKIIRETEEINLHSFVNTIGTTHIKGVYQFVDKIYKAQVFNYGKRQMFDLMVPEPASYLWHLEKAEPLSKKYIDPPAVFNINPLDILYKDEEKNKPNHYTNLIKRYGTVGVMPAPDAKSVSFKYQYPAPDENGNIKVSTESENLVAPPASIEVDIPAGYTPVSVNAHFDAFSDRGNEVAVTLVVGKTGAMIKTGASTYSGLTLDRGGADDAIRMGEIGIETVDWNPLQDQGKLHIGFLLYESGNHVITGVVQCEPSPELVKNWQLGVYNKVMTSYQDRYVEYQDMMQQIEAEERAQKQNQGRAMGIPPAKRKQTILTELKKHALSLFFDNAIYHTSWHTDDPFIEPITPTALPQFNIAKAKKRGDFIRFFEQAFEWDQMQYAFYSYFWGQQVDWSSRFQKEDSDYEFQQFLQAGSARVVVSVRPGFEEAVAHYLETGEIWNGQGAPSIGNPLYVSIINEIKEKTGGTEFNPVPVGQPWEVRIPTDLIMLRSLEGLPSWSETEEGSWEWRTNE